MGAAAALLTLINHVTEAAHIRPCGDGGLHEASYGL